MTSTTTALGTGTGHRVEDKLDVRIALLGSTRMTVGALDPTDFHIRYIADDLGPLLHLPSPHVPAGSQHGGERDRRVELLGSGVAVL